MITALLSHVLLLTTRLLPVMVVAPVLPFARIPRLVRITLTVLLAVLMVKPTSPVSITPGLLLGEFGLGLLMAFGFHVVHAGLDMAGRLVDSQVGINAAGVLDPSSENVTGLVAELLVLVLCLVFVALDIHLALLQAISQLVLIVPLGQVSPDLFSLSVITQLGEQLLLAFMTLSPVILGLWLTDVAFAFVARSLPQANVYFLALPIKLCVGTFLLLATLPLLMQRIPVLLENALRFTALRGGLT